MTSQAPCSFLVLTPLSILLNSSARDRLQTCNHPQHDCKERMNTYYPTSSTWIIYMNFQQCSQWKETFPQGITVPYAPTKRMALHWLERGPSKASQPRAVSSTRYKFPQASRTVLKLTAPGRQPNRLICYAHSSVLVIFPRPGHVRKCALLYLWPANPSVHRWRTYTHTFLLDSSTACYKYQ